mgnify:CR=1 FL=1
MGDLVASPVQLREVSKCYRIFRNPQDRFKQAMLDRFHSVLYQKNTKTLYREHWALCDISFELKPAEALGVVGRNGAGKSTLLQLIAGTLEPTFGAVTTNGRITALLELGSGFNPEFTGRENVFLNAQILGLSLEDTLDKFSDIASFADIGDYIEQPVKTYSTGMLMRLAFAVQTVLTPDVLIVDEALSVGDARFQEKCYRKLRQLRDNGTAILFVSHDINSVVGFCDQAILLDAGKLVTIGTPKDVANSYLKLLYSDQSSERYTVNEVQIPPGSKENVGFTTPDAGVSKGGYGFGNNNVEILSVKIFKQDGSQTNVLVSGNKYRIVQEVIVNADVNEIRSGFIIRDKRGVDIFGITNKTANRPIPKLSSGEVFELSIEIDAWLAAGDYFLQAANADESGVQYDCRIDALHFKVIDTPVLFESSIVNLNPKLHFRLLSNPRKFD